MKRSKTGYLQIVFMKFIFTLHTIYDECHHQGPPESSTLRKKREDKKRLLNDVRKPWPRGLADVSSERGERMKGWEDLRSQCGEEKDEGMGSYGPEEDAREEETNKWVMPQAMEDGGMRMKGWKAGMLEKEGREEDIRKEGIRSEHMKDEGIRGW